MCDCPTRKVSGFPMTNHQAPCPDRPLGACAGCGHDVFAGELEEHTDCDTGVGILLTGGTQEPAYRPYAPLPRGWEPTKRNAA